MELGEQLPLPTAAASQSDDEDLSDSQIEQLLNQAEVRLRSTADRALSRRHLRARAAASARPRFPAAPVQSEKGVSRIPASEVLDAPAKQIADAGVKNVEDPVVLRDRKAKAKKANAGPRWFNMPRTDLTPQLKRDLQILKLRGVLDPQRHYKKDNSRPSVPEFSQVGTLVEGPGEFFSGRIPRKQRHKTIFEDVLASERSGEGKSQGRLKRKYEELQVGKQSGKKGFYKEAMRKRYGNKALKR